MERQGPEIVTDKACHLDTYTGLTLTGALPWRCCVYYINLDRSNIHFSN